jgi:hypothetical protein
MPFCVTVCVIISVIGSPLLVNRRLFAYAAVPAPVRFFVPPRSIDSVLFTGER